MEQNFNLMKLLALLVVAILGYKNMNAQNVSTNDTVRSNHFLADIPTVSYSMLHEGRASWNNAVNPKAVGLLDRKRSQSRKISKLLGYTGQAFIVSSIFVGKADKQFGKGIFLAGCTIAPIAFIFSLHGRRSKDRVPKLNQAYVEKPLIE